MGREYEKAVDYVRRMISSGSLNVGGQTSDRAGVVA